MAKIKQGILGGFSGSVANVVGSSWKGIAVMKAKPLSVANPQTAAQVAQRVKFRAGSELSTEVKNAIIKPFWDRFASKMSGVNAWMSENVRHYDNNGRPNLNELVMSKGNIGAQPITSASYDTGNKEFTVTWDSSNMPSNGLDTDNMAICVVGDDNETYGIREAGLKVRSDDTDTFPELKTPPSTVTMYAYLISKRPDGTIVSETARLQVAIP